MSFRHTTGFEIEFGDCDPVGIVFYPNYYRWMDAAARHFFLAAGVPSWTETAASDGIIGAPLLETSARYLKPATYGERIAVAEQNAWWMKFSHYFPKQKSLAWIAIPSPRKTHIGKS